jgi:putative transposase
MGRIARIVVAGHAHHVTHRGIRRGRTFFHDQDYSDYLSLLKEWSKRWGNEILAYCLMPNHVHLIVVPRSEDGLARGIGETHRRYAREVNAREGFRGRLWKGRFASVVVDEMHLLDVARFVERNPIRSGLAKRAEDWRWSSAAGHVWGEHDSNAQGLWLSQRLEGGVYTWSEWLRTPDDPALASAIRQCERTGRPLGDLKFLGRVGQLLGRDLIPKKPGPQAKRPK